MKKLYLSPEVRVNLITFEQNILSNGENLNVSTYGSRGVDSDDVDDFWE